ncbi:MAG: serine hydrolase [Chloroflexota bacterium]|nr:serine hydrolase [Chloroflexota bacterium]
MLRSMGQRFRASLLVLLVAALVVGPGSPVAVVAREAGTETAAQPATVPRPPRTSAAAVYVWDATAGQVLYALNADDQRAPASTTKIATALVVVRNADLDDEVVVAAGDTVDTTVFSHMGLQAGDTLTVEQLLYGLLLPSGNDAANALARTVGESLRDTYPEASGPVGAFVMEMNAFVETLGLVDTQFLNPAGEDDEGHYSSAHDLAVLAAELLKDPTLAEIAGTPAWQGTSVGPEQRFFDLVNTNQLLAEDPSVVGVKTGTTENAGACLVVAREVEAGNVVISVTLGSDPPVYDDAGNATDVRFDEMNTVFEALDRDYVWVSPSSPGEVAGLSEEMAAWQVALKPGPAVAVPAEEAGELSYRLRLGPPADPNERVGRVLFFVGSRQIGELPLYQAPLLDQDQEGDGAVAVGGEAPTPEPNP